LSDIVTHSDNKNSIATFVDIGGIIICLNFLFTARQNNITVETAILYARNAFLAADPYLLYQRCISSLVKDFTFIVITSKSNQLHEVSSYFTLPD